MSMINNTLTVKKPRAWRQAKKVLDLIQYYYTDEFIKLALKCQSVNPYGRVESMPEYKILAGKVREEYPSFIGSVQ